MGTPPLWTDRLMDGQTRVKNITFPRTTYAGGNKEVEQARNVQFCRDNYCLIGTFP